MRSLAVAMSLLGLCVLGSIATAQSDPPQSDPQPDKPTLREEIERRLEHLREQQDELLGALQRLDEGVSETRVREMIDEHIGRRGPEDHGDHGGPGGPDDERGDDRRLSSEETKRVLEFIEQHFPLLWERIADVSPDFRERMAARFAPRYFEVERATNRDPTLGRLKLVELKTGFGLLEAIGNLRRAMKDNPGSSGVEAAKLDVRRALEMQFDAQQASKQQEVILLDDRVGELERELREREAERDAILNDKLESIESGIERGDDRKRRRRGGGPH